MHSVKSAKHDISTLKKKKKIILIPNNQCIGKINISHAAICVFFKDLLFGISVLLCIFLDENFVSFLW